MKQIRCFSCKQKFTETKDSNDHYCSECLRAGKVSNRKLYLTTCEFCGTQFSYITKSHKPKYCSKECYGAWKCSEKNPESKIAKALAAAELRKTEIPKQSEPKYCVICGGLIPESRGSKAIVCSPECAAVRKKDYRKKYKGDGLSPQVTKEMTAKQKAREASVKSFKDITKLCCQLHITYGYYQQLEMLGQLDQYIKDHLN